MSTEVPATGGESGGRREDRHAAMAVPREARPFQGQRAGIVTRVIANAIDLSVAVGIVLGCYAGYATFRFLLNPVSFSWPPTHFLVFLAGGFVALFALFTVAWATSGRTLGDSIMGLRVVNYAGNRVHLPGAAVRALFCTALPIGLFWILVSPSNRSVQDTVLRTSCIYDWLDRPFTFRRSED